MLTPWRGFCGRRPPRDAPGVRPREGPRHGRSPRRGLRDHPRGFPEERSCIWPSIQSSHSNQTTRAPLIVVQTRPKLSKCVQSCPTRREPRDGAAARVTQAPCCSSAYRRPNKFLSTPMDKAWLLPPLPVHRPAVLASLLVVRPDVPPDLARARAPRGHPRVTVFVIWALAG